jgi:membrane dipeptidase
MAVAERPALSERARALHAKSIVVDGCSFFLRGYNDRVQEGGLTAINFTVPLPMDDLTQAVIHIKEYLEVARKDPKVEIPRTAADIERCKAEGKLAAIIGSQNSRHFGTDLGMIEVFHLLGQRVCQITYNERNFVADGCMEPDDAGVSFFGRQVIRELNEIGMVIDLSHVGVRSSLEATELSEHPVVISHIGVKRFVDTPRTTGDELIRAVAAKGGVIGVTSLPVVNWRGGDRRPSLDDYLEAIEHAISVAGVDHVGIGTDHVVEPNGYPQWVRDYLSAKYNPYFPERGDRMGGLAEVLKGAELEPDEQLEGFRGMQDMPRVTQALLDRGYSDEDVQKVLGGNFMRVFRTVWGR